jgi:hypothetical protein
LNEAILRRTRLWTTITAAGLALATALLVSPLFAAGLLLTALWAVAGFWILEKLLRAALVPAGHRRNGLVIAGWGLAKLGVYGLALWAVLAGRFPPVSLLVGFTLLLVVLVGVGIASAPGRMGQPARRGDDG